MTTHHTEEALWFSKLLLSSSSEGNAELYRHLTPLGRGQIRLITLYPGTYYEPIVCSMRIAHLNHDPVYYALSYSWGRQFALENITINDKTNYKVTRSLFTGLRRLRHVHDPRNLWIDAICINQADEDERASQVKIMGLIYSQASQVRIWLGEATELPGYEARAAELPDAFSDLTRDAIILSETMGKHAWYKRLWVVQEFLLARSVVVHFGSTETTWKEFVQAIHGCSFEILGYDDKSTFHNFDSTVRSVSNLNSFKKRHGLGHRRRSATQGKMLKHDSSLEQDTRQGSGHGTFHDGELTAVGPAVDLRDLLMYAIHSNASLGHDRIYALLPLALRHQSEAIEIDYSLDLEELFASAALIILKEHGTIHGIVGPWQRFKHRGHESWVPDFRTTTGSYHPIGVKSAGAVFLARHAKFEIRRTSAHRHLLAVRGVFLAESEWRLLCRSMATAGEWIETAEDEVCDFFLCCGAPYLWKLRPLQGFYALLEEKFSSSSDSSHVSDDQVQDVLIL